MFKTKAVEVNVTDRIASGIVDVVRAPGGGGACSDRRDLERELQRSKNSFGWTVIAATVLPAIILSFILI